MRIKEADVQGLLECIERYFMSIKAVKPEFGVPYNLDMKATRQPLFDYTGHIGITGSHKGGLVVTCEKKLVEKLVTIVLGTENPGDDEVIPMIGEMANTIAGNARVHFGSGFDISVPSVVVGVPEEFKFLLAEPTLVIPFTWEGCAGNAIIGLT
ncbi:MAG: chemotaxis protein CheX [Spirochaetes bacterium]|nr:chemotaxis protein CheX [Spirochaetota bacterium]MBX3720369.1 chemotaxis protein CheX [Turneriella sp.]